MAQLPQEKINKKLFIENYVPSYIKRPQLFLYAVHLYRYSSSFRSYTVRLNRKLKVQFTIKIKTNVTYELESIVVDLNMRRSDRKA